MRAAALVLASLLVPSSGAAGPSNPPQVDYMLQCQGCHLADGMGAPEAGVPMLKGSMARFLAVPGGREYLVRVPGASGSLLTDAELARVLNWMIAYFGPAAQAKGFAPFTEAEVAGVRRPPFDRVDDRRRKLLELFDAQAP